MSLDEIVSNVRQILTRNAKKVGVVVIAGSEHNRGRVIRLPVVPPLNVQAELTWCRVVGEPGSVQHVLSRTYVETIVLGNPAIVDEPIPTIRLLMTRNEGYSADLDSLGCGEEGHAEWVPFYGRHDGAPIEEHTADPRLLGGNAYR
jgi:hypothetical protein